jgi:hypothetical protein
MLEIAEGMNYLHSKVLVHRDLKTDNILISVMVLALKVKCGIQWSSPSGLPKSRILAAQ